MVLLCPGDWLGVALSTACLPLDGAESAALLLRILTATTVNVCVWTGVFLLVRKSRASASRWQRGARAATRAVFVVIALLAAVVFLKSLFANTGTWYVAAPGGQVFIDGRRVAGRVFEGTRLRWPRNTYSVLVSLPSGRIRSHVIDVVPELAEPIVYDYGQWIAPRSPGFFLEPERMSWEADPCPACPGPPPNVVTTGRSLEFNSRDGRRIRVSW